MSGPAEGGGSIAAATTAAVPLVPVGGGTPVPRSWHRPRRREEDAFMERCPELEPALGLEAVGGGGHKRWRRGTLLRL